MKFKYEHQLIIRILIAILITIVFLKLFYRIFFPLTIYPVYYFLKLFFEGSLIGNIILINEYNLNFIEACVATMAYFLLAMLILFTKDINLKKRIYMFLVGSILILAFNIIRIIVLIIILLVYGANAFESVHLFIWGFVSTLYVFLVWIILIKMFKVKSIPIYSDLKELYKKSYFRKK